MSTCPHTCRSGDTRVQNTHKYYQLKIESQNETHIIITIGRFEGEQKGY